jgi:hypothetical protein
MAFGLIISAIGLGVQTIGQIQQTKAMKQAEAQRQKQANLEATRQRRDIVRNAIMARSTAVSNAANQGAQYGSGLPGGIGQIEGRAGNQQVASEQNQEIGNNIFAANKKYYNASVLTDIGGGLSSLGNMFMSQAATFQRVGQVGYF